MNPQEYEALQSLLRQVVKVHGVETAPEADLLFREAVAPLPAGTYLLAQHTQLLSAALNEARSRAEARGQGSPARRRTAPSRQASDLTMQEAG